MKNEQGQSAVISVIFLTVLLGMTAFVLDVGSWFRADRAAQATADAAALAGAQALPADPGKATALALEYADKNGGGVLGANVTFTSKFETNDTIKVTLDRPAPGFFAKLFGVDSVTVNAKAAARATAPAEAKYVAPIAVEKRHPLLYGGGSSCPCFNQPTVLELEKVAPGAFRLMNLDGSRGGTGPPTLADWILHGLAEAMPLGWYYSDPGAKFNSSHVKDAMNQRIDDELLFPVYDTVQGNGANAQYKVVGWVGFHITDFEAKGNTGKVWGWFTRYIAQGLPATTNSGDPNFGTHVITMVE